MSDFTELEINYLRQQRLGRLATVDRRGHPHVAPVGFRFDPATDAILIGGHRFGASKKFRDARDQGVVAFVVDDLASVEPWQPRGVEVRGTVDATTRDGGPAAVDDDWMIRIRPTRIVGWGLDTDAFGPPNARDVATGDTAGAER